MEALLKMFQTFVVDSWYKILILLSLLLFVLAITTDLHAIPNGALVLLSIGLFMIGIGEWVNHPYQERLDQHFRFKLVGHPRKWSLGGIMLDIVGAVIGGLGLLKIIIAAI